MDENKMQDLFPQEPEFSLEDIMKEFGAEEAGAEEVSPAEEGCAASWEETPADSEADTAYDGDAEEENIKVWGEDEDMKIAGEESQEEAGEEEEAHSVSEADSSPMGDAIGTDDEAAQNAAGMDGATIRLDTTHFAQGQVRDAAPIDEEEEAAQPTPPADDKAFTTHWEPEYEQPMGEYVPPQPIIIHPRSRLRELKKKLVAGPEKRYYQLSELGLGKLQIAMFVSLLVLLGVAATTVLYALGKVGPERMKLLVFGQFFAMLLSALLGSFQLVEGVADLLRKRFTLNTLLVAAFILCCVDGVFCLMQVRMPCCAAFCLMVFMSLWQTYEVRNTELGMMDTMRKATHLNSLELQPDYHEGKGGLLKGEGQVEDFMDHYNAPSKPEKIMSWYALAVLAAAIALGVVAGVFHNVFSGIQVAAVTLLAGVPVTAFITFSRPMAILERRLHAVGTVLCGWRGVESLSGKVVYPLTFQDLFPAGAAKMNGVKFFGDLPTEEVIAYCTALISASGSGLAPIFTQVLESRNGRHYDPVNLRLYENGGIGGEVEDKSVLVGSLRFLKEMGVEVPEGIRVSQAVCVAVEGELAGLFAITYDKSRATVTGLAALNGYRKLESVVVAPDFMLCEEFVRTSFGINPKRTLFPAQEVRVQLAATEKKDDNVVTLLTTREGLNCYAYGVAGARSLKKACKAGLIVHMIGGIVGIAIMLLLTLIGRLDLLTPANIFALQLVWMIRGFLVTCWTKSV